MKTLSNLTETLALCVRNTTYYARFRLSTGRYVWQSLNIADTPKSNRKKAEQAALLYAGSVHSKQQEGQPIVQTPFAKVIVDYVKLKVAEHDHGRISSGMIRQVNRVARYWTEYAGSKPASAIGNKELEEYVGRRMDYYKSCPLAQNAKRNLADKTLQWEITFGKSILPWAHGRGYLGNKILPTWSFKVKQRNVRPCFTWPEYNKLWRALIKWEEDCVQPDRLHTRQLLRDYVLILANSGMRVGEANSLRLKDIRQSKDSKNRQIYEFMVSGKTGARTVTLRAHAAKYVDRLLKRHPKNAPGSFLFCMVDGRQVTTLAEQFDKVLELAGIKENNRGQK